jgi:hypothetical protein
MLDRTLSFRTNDIVLTADLAVAGAVFYFLRVSVGYGYDKKHGFNRDESSVAARGTTVFFTLPEGGVG